MSGVSNATLRAVKQDHSEAMVQVRKDLYARMTTLADQTSESLDGVLSYAKGVDTNGQMLAVELRALREEGRARGVDWSSRWLRTDGRIHALLWAVIGLATAQVAVIVWLLTR